MLELGRILARNKLIRRYRERQARKILTKTMLMYIVRIASESAPVLVKYRSIPVSEKCREKGHTQRAKCCKSNVTDSLESSVENTSELRVLALCKLRTLRVRTRAFGPRLGKSQL